jgi:ABC-2 type transport system permease protein
MLRSIFAKTLWDQRVGILAWSVAIALVGVVYAAFYPSMSSPEMAAAMDAFPPEFMAALGMADVTSPAGYLGSTTYGILGPVLSIIFGTSLGARAIAGDEEDGRLEVLMAHPVERRSIVLQRAAAILVALGVAGIALYLAMLAISGPAQLTDIGPANLAAATLQLVLLALVFATLALAVGALTGRPGLATGSVALVAVATYFANTLGPTTDFLAWTQKISPFYYYSGGQPLVNGLQVGDSLVLAGTAVVLVVIGIGGFLRRDIGV